MLRQVDSQGLRLVYVTDDGYHPSDYYQSVLQKMPDPRRPWRYLEWIRIIDYYHACQYVQQLADSLFGPGAESQSWATRMRKQLKTQTAGVTRVLQSAAALRHKRGLRGQAQVYEHAYAYLHKRRRWMRYQVYRRQPLAHRLGHHGSRVQDCVHAAAQALGDGVDESGWPSHPGSAGDLVEWCLGRCASTILGVQTSACPSRVYGYRRSA